MRELTPEEEELQKKRIEAFSSFVADINPALMKFAEFVGVENPRTAVEQPEKFLQVLDAFLKQGNIDELEQKDKEWLHLMLMYFVGQLFLHRYGGIWFLNDDDPDSKSFLRYVVGYFEEESMSDLVVDPFRVAAEFLVLPPGRSFISIIKEVEEEMGL